MSGSGIAVTYCNGIKKSHVPKQERIMCSMCTMTDRCTWHIILHRGVRVLANNTRYEKQDAQKKQTMKGIGRGTRHTTGTEMQVFMIKREADF